MPNLIDTISIAKDALNETKSVKEKIISGKSLVAKYFDVAIEKLIEYTPKLILALLVLIIGLWIIKRIARLADKAMLSRDLEVSLRTFLRSLISIGLKIILIITVAGMIGIGTTSFVTILGAAGLAVGLALQGSLSNFAGGVLILIFKPFKVGDVIEAQSQTGEVKEIQIFNTILLTADHKTVILANGPLSNGTIVNTTRYGSLRIDVAITVGSDNNLPMIKELIKKVLSENAKILPLPQPGIYFGRVIDGSVTINIKPFCKPSDTSSLSSELYHDIKAIFDTNNILPPIPTHKVISK
ncbi:MAG: mechanosensitive ion channel family protein [Bacteroidetes bacterium]|nr:mechanosensitive ion channel family protein [Bacteroidota bacterium]